MDKQTMRREHGVLVRLSDLERHSLDQLCEQEGRPRAQLIRRLIAREVRASNQTGETVMVK